MYSILIISTFGQQPCCSQTGCPCQPSCTAVCGGGIIKILEILARK